MNKLRHVLWIAPARVWVILLLPLVTFTRSPGGVHHGLFMQESRSVSVSQTDPPRIVVSSSSSRIALVAADNALKLFDGASLAEQATLQGAEGQISVLSFSSDGRTLLAGTVGGTIHAWNLANGALIRTLKPQSNPIVGLDALRGSVAITATNDGSIEFRDWISGEKISSLPDFKEQATCRALHPGGKWMAIGTSDGHIHIYDLVQATDAKVLATNGGKITAMITSPDGRFLCSGSSDGSVRTWDVGRWIPRNSLLGQHGEITSLSIDPKSRWLVSTAKDSSLRVYNLFTGEQLKSISWPGGYYSFASFVSDKALCTATSDGFLKTVLMLDAPPDSIPPTILITRPVVDPSTNSAKIYEKEYTLEGVAYDDSMVARITVAGNPVKMFDLDPSDTLRFPPGVKTKGFKETMKLDSLGFGQVELQAFDECENDALLDLTTQRLPSNEAIEVIAPIDSGDVDRISTRLKFKIWLEGASFTVSNNLLELANSREIKNKLPGDLITVEIPLVYGYNQIQISAVGKTGGRLSKTIGINRRLSALKQPAALTALKSSTKPNAINPGEDRGIGMQRWAVVVGISHYANADIAQLNYADADAKSLADFLQTPEGGSFESDHMNVLLNQDATLANVRNALYNFASQAIDSDLVLIYFAGHGAPNPLKPDQLYLLTYDSDPSLLRTTAFPMWDIQTVLDRYINARKVVVFTDACHSGGISTEMGTRGLASGKTNPINQYLTNLAKAKDGVVVFTASAQNEVSQESPDFGHGVFTYYLLDGLKGKADLNNDNVVTINELMTYVEVQVKRHTKGYQNPTRSQTNYDKELPMSIITH
ncbi:MAG: caspase family protein [Bacteroidota bacterium]